MDTKKKIITFTIMIWVLLVATSCTVFKDNGKKSVVDDYYSGKLTADEMSGEHIKLELFM